MKKRLLKNHNGMQECKKNNTCHVYNISKDKATLNKKKEVAN